jgi:hypothetical protein
MKQTNTEHGIVGVISTLVILVLMFVVEPANAAECAGAHQSPCEDLIGAEVTFEKVGSTKFESVCGDGADACAVLSVSLKQCTIYYRTRRISAKTVNHEMNHCRGWFHKQNRASKYNRPWVDINTYLGS